MFYEVVRAKWSNVLGAMKKSEPYKEIDMDAIELAQLFHETYEKLAPLHNYKTREASAKPWEDVPKENKSLMIAVAKEILEQLQVSKP